jgi:5-methylcytosine-specific restriction endonuclease McrA
MKVSKEQRESIRMMFGGRCAYCGCELSAGWHIDHVKAVGHDLDYRPGRYDENDNYIPSKYVKNGRVLRPENDTIENLYPACRACNIDKSSMPLEEWRQDLEELPNRMRKYLPNFRHAERFGLLVQMDVKVVFWFEKYRANQNLSA